MWTASAGPVAFGRRPRVAKQKTFVEPCLAGARAFDGGFWEEVMIKSVRLGMLRWRQQPRSWQPRGATAMSVADVEALCFDVFGTVVDWRGSVAREAAAFFGERGISRDWHAFADGWRARYQPAMEEVRSGRCPLG